jgi:hypothetical protein
MSSFSPLLKHDYSQPDKPGADQQNAKRRKDAHWIAGQCFKNPDANVQPTEQKEHALTRSAVFLRSRSDEPEESDDHADDTNHDGERCNVMHVAIICVQNRSRKIQGRGSPLTLRTS